MFLKFFTVSIHDGSESAQELNRFLGSHRIVSMNRELIHDGSGSCWAICVTYVHGETPKSAEVRKGRIDYREVLSESDFALFAKLRSLRKEIAEREGVPAYALFTNEQLAAMVTGRVSSIAGLREIDGVGPSRIDKHGASFLDLLKANDHRPTNTDETVDAQS